MGVGISVLMDVAKEAPTHSMYIGCKTCRDVFAGNKYIGDSTRADNSNACRSISRALLRRTPSDELLLD